MQEAQTISMEQLMREHRIANAVHILEEALEDAANHLQYSGCGYLNFARDVLARYRRAAIADKLEPERPQRYMHRETGDTVTLRRYDPVNGYASVAVGTDLEIRIPLGEWHHSWMED
jgi:hypothetical protein